MAASFADRNLLFAVLALQNDLVAKEALLSGMHAWVLEKHRTLGELLVERGAMAVEHRHLLDALIEAQVRKHGTAGKSLQALEVSLSAREALASVPDTGVQASVAALKTTPPEEDPWATEPPTATTFVPLRFRRLRPHAKGGLGEVSVALDQDLHREVALKEIQDRFADHPESRARFLVEGEITGGLEHPGIVPVYAMGTYPDGRPYYAMRFIKGDNLHSAIERFHADKPVQFDTLAFRKLLGRFLDTCDAVAYAHSRGVLHRDLKPANVMLGKFGETLVVDWGLAKVLPARSASDGLASDGLASDEPRLVPMTSSGTGQTVSGSVVGTPGFMSPEQAAGRLDLLGPATDVYSLGATLYAVLTGRAAIEKGDVGEKLRQAERGDWPAPRQVNPAIPKALEAICLKAMALKPADRYAMATALAEDLEHWLADEPVTAYREPVTARARRWARKHPGMVSGMAATVLVGLLAAGTGAAVLGHKNRQLEVARNEAVASADRERDAKEKERDAKEQTQKRLVQIERGTDLLGSIFADLDPYAEDKKGKELGVILAGHLKAAAAQLDGEAIGDPLTVAKLQHILGVSLRTTGEMEEAVRLLEKSVVTRTAMLGEDHSTTLNSRNSLAVAYKAAGKLDLAIPLYERTLRAREAKLGDDHRDTLLSRNNLAVAYKVAGKLDLAIPLYERTIKTQEAKLGDDHPNTLLSRGNLALAYQEAGKLDLAITLLERTLKAREAKLGDDHPDTLRLRNNLASAYQEAGKLNLAIPLQERTLKGCEDKLGDDHPLTLTSRGNLAGAYQDAGKLNLAIPLYERTLKAREAKSGDDHPDTLTSRNNLARAYQDAGNLELAIPLYERTLKGCEDKLGDNSPLILALRNNLARAYQKAGKLDLAIPLHERTLKAIEAKLGDDHPDTLISRGNLAIAYKAAGKLDLAFPLFAKLAARQAKDVAALRKQLKPDDPRLVGSLAQLALTLLHANKPADAEPILRECLTIREKTEPDAWTTSNTRSLLGGALLAQNKPKDAEPLLRQGYEGLKARAAKIPPQGKVRLREAVERLVQLADALGNKEDAAKWRKELAALAEQHKNAKP